jgi:hypothetical protein
MGEDTKTDREQVVEDDRGYSVVAAEKKVAKKKAKKKTAKKKTAAKKAATAKKKDKAAAEPASQPVPAFAPPSEEARSGGAMRGIIALWGPLAIIVLLIVVSRLGDEEPGALGRGAAAGLSASLESAESIARDVVEDVQDALTGGDPQVAAVLDTRASGRSSSGSTSSDLAAAFYDAGATSAPPPPPSSSPSSSPLSSKQAATAADAWGRSDQTTTPASLSGLPGALPPHPENPWAPVDPRSATAMSAEPNSQTYSPAYPPAYSQGGGTPAPVAPYGYGAPPQPQGYPPLPPDYGSAPPPAYGGMPPGYSQQQAYGAAPPAYGEQPSYGYLPQPYGAPAPYPPGYYLPSPVAQPSSPAQ